MPTRFREIPQRNGGIKKCIYSGSIIIGAVSPIVVVIKPRNKLIGRANIIGTNNGFNQQSPIQIPTLLVLLEAYRSLQTAYTHVLKTSRHIYIYMLMALNYTPPLLSLALVFPFPTSSVIRGTTG